MEGCVDFGPTLNFETTTEYIKRMANINIGKLIMSYMAVHPQYSGEKLSVFKQNFFEEIKQKKGILNQKKIHNLEKDFISLKENAEKIGCTKENKTLFFTNHIFCDSIKNQLDRDHITFTNNIEKINNKNIFFDFYSNFTYFFRKIISNPQRQLQ